MAWKWTTQGNFLALSIPALISAVGIFAVEFAMGDNTVAHFREGVAAGHELVGGAGGGGIRCYIGLPVPSPRLWSNALLFVRFS